MQLVNEFEPIRDWANERGLYDKGDPKTQFVKLAEEVGELAQGILKSDHNLINDSIGDCVVVLTNLAALCGTTIEHCINGSFQEIVNRKGKMQNGTFVKEISDSSDSIIHGTFATEIPDNSDSIIHEEL